MPRGAWPRVRPCTPHWPRNWTGDRFSSLSLKVTGRSLPARLRSHGSHMLTPPVAGSIPTFGEQWQYRGGRRTSVGARRNKIIGSIAVTALVAGLLTIWPGSAHALPVEKTIAEIQGTGDTSPEAGNAVTTPLVVTALPASGEVSPVPWISAMVFSTGSAYAAPGQIVRSPATSAVTAIDPMILFRRAPTLVLRPPRYDHCRAECRNRSGDRRGQHVGTM